MLLFDNPAVKCHLVRTRDQDIISPRNYQPLNVIRLELTQSKIDSSLYIGL